MDKGFVATAALRHCYRVYAFPKPCHGFSQLTVQKRQCAGRDAVRKASVECARDSNRDARQSVGVATKGNGQSDSVLIIRRIEKSSYGLWDCFLARPFL
jgi:hypothetical protein